MLEPTQCCALRSKKWISSISGSPAALVTKPIRSPGGGSGRRRLANVRPTALQKPPASVLAPRRSSSWIQIVVSHPGARLSLWPPPGRASIAARLKLAQSHIHRTVGPRGLLAHAPRQIDRLEPQVLFHAHLPEAREYHPLQYVALPSKVAKRRTHKQPDCGLHGMGVES